MPEPPDPPAENPTGTGPATGKPPDLTDPVVMRAALAELRKTVDAPPVSNRIGCIPITTLVVVVLLLVLGFPALRERLCGLLPGETKQEIASNKVWLVSCVEYTRIVLEVVLAISISSLVFNRELQDWTKRQGSNLTARLIERALTAIEQKTIPQAVALQRELIQLTQEKEILKGMELPLPDRAEEAARLYLKASKLASRRWWWMQLLMWKVGWVLLLHQLKRTLLALIASASFLGVLLMKVLKQYADCGVFSAVGH